MIGLVDVNNFYVSCERVFNPKLRNRPVIVLSNNDGCVISRSNEAKEVGIPMAAPYFQLKELIRKHQVKVFSSNYALYGDLSNRFVEELEAFTPEVEQYSIDESYLHYNGFRRYGLIKHNQRLVRTIRQNVGLPICVGLAPTYTLAKVANHYAKSLSVPDGVLELSTPRTIKAALENLPVNEIWGVGKQLARHLNDLGVYTALELRDCDIKTTQKILGVVVERTILELRGTKAITLKDMTEDKKQIICGRSFGRKITELSELQSAISQYIHESSVKLRKQNSVCGRLSVFIRTNNHEQIPQHSATLTSKFIVPTDDTRTLMKEAYRLLKKMYRPGFLYYKAGIMLSKLSPEDSKQSDLFSPNIDSPELMKSMDKINKHFGRNAIQIGTANLTKGWRMKQNLLSPKYTTKWQSLMLVNC